MKTHTHFGIYGLLIEYNKVLLIKNDKFKKSHAQAFNKFLSKIKEN